MSIQDFVGNTDCAVRVLIVDGLGSNIAESPILIRPADLQDLQRECFGVAAKFGQRYLDTVKGGRFRELLRGDEGDGEPGADTPNATGPAERDQAADPAAVTDDGPAERIVHPVPAEPRPVSRGESEPLPYEAGTNTLFLDREPVVDDDGASDLCIMLRPGLRKAARLAWAARDIVQRLRLDDEDEAPSEAWSEEASEALEVIVDDVGRCVEQLNVDFDDWNAGVVNKSHCVYLTGEAAKWLEELCALFPDRDAQGEPSGLNRSRLVVECALKVLKYSGEPAKVMAGMDEMAGVYINLKRRQSGEPELTARESATEPEAETAGV